KSQIYMILADRITLFIESYYNETRETKKERKKKTKFPIEQEEKPCNYIDIFFTERNPKIPINGYKRSPPQNKGYYSTQKFLLHKRVTTEIIIIELNDQIYMSVHKSKLEVVLDWFILNSCCIRVRI
ncbi:hypothetical protein ACJX0J_019429, partial [Zea mays]